MTEYVKICPRCETANPEHEHLCGNCGNFLGLVRAEPRPAQAKPALETTPARPEPVPDPVPAEQPPPAPEPQAEAELDVEEIEAVPAQKPGRSARPVLYLESLVNGKSFTVPDQAVVGQAHPTSRADVQLEGVPDLNYVSRHHCRFDHESNVWFVTSLSSAMNGTTLNQAPLMSGGRARLKNGDELVMANVPFRVRIAG